MSGPPALGAGPLAIIAGAGRLPLEVATEARAGGHEVVILALRGIADADFGSLPREPVDLMNPSGAVTVLRRIGASALVFAGSAHKPRLGHILAGWQAVRHREEIRRIVQGGDDNLLRGVVGFFEASGFPVLGVSDVAPGLMAGTGKLTRCQPGASDVADIERGFAAIAALGPLDVGQAVAVAELRILAVEAAEGTDAMLRRVALLRHPGAMGRVLRFGRPPVAERQGGVLVKAPKPGQDFRVDLPAVGARTVRRAAAAGLTGIAVRAGGVLFVERAAMIAEADRLGLFVAGVAR